MRVIDNKVDFQSYGQLPFRQTEKWLKTIPLRPKTFTDGGYRIQENKVVRDDSWINLIHKKVFTFYNLIDFNHDVLNTENQMVDIAQIYFRI